VPRVFPLPTIDKHASGSAGTVLLELVVSSLILVVVILAIGTFFVGHLKAFDRGKEQMELQRVGTLVMEGMARAIREGNRVEGFLSGGIVEGVRIFYPGEPFFDANHNGLWDLGEGFVDMYRTDAAGSSVGFEGVWNCASEGIGSNPLPTVYFGLDTSDSQGGVIRRGTDPSDSVPWEIVASSATGGRLWCDKLEFGLPSNGEPVLITLDIRNDMGTTDPADDMAMSFSSSVNLRR
jgi:hypothetical protein